eukprot:CCRYP_018817-RA/>CCRYP_018817-RA protein AED:0.12 eAED:0.12 QI:536/1/1/1/1/1/3/354/517
MTETAATSTADTLLKAIVNLDEKQLRNVDDEESYGAADDIADGQRSQQRQPQQASNVNGMPALTQDRNEISDANDINLNDSDESNNNSRRNRLKQAILSKWKPRRLLPIKKQSEEQQQQQLENEDVEASYIPLDDKTSPTITTSLLSPASLVATALASLKMQKKQFRKEATSNNLEDNTSSQNNTNESLEPKLSTELFHWYINRSWKKKLLTLLVVASSAFVLHDLFVGGNEGGKVHGFLHGFLEWMEDHPLGGVYAYICVLALTSLVYIPPSPLIFSSGFIFRSIYGSLSGPLLALLASYIGAVIGGSIGFLRANYMTRDLIRILMRRYPLLRAIDAAVVRNSLRVMILLRLNPLIPFGVLNYLFGISGVSGVSFVLGVVGVVPWHLWLICLGASANSLVYDVGEEENSVVRIVLLGMGSAFGVIGLVITWKFAKKELQKEVNSHAISDFRIQDPDQTPQVSTRRNGNEIEEADLEFADYLKMQLFGMKVDENVEVGEEDYRSKLDWAERLLDDFS